MKHFHLTFFFALIASITSNQAFAYDIAVENDDGVTIYYNYANDGAELEVTNETATSKSYSGSVDIPETVTYMDQTRSVTGIGYRAFGSCEDLTSVTIPEGVTSIGYAAFFGCSGLTSVTLPLSLTSIGDYAFDDCFGLTSVTLPEEVTSIGSYAFFGCSGLTSVTIPEEVTSIGGGAFQNCI